MPRKTCDATGSHAVRRLEPSLLGAVPVDRAFFEGCRVTNLVKDHAASMTDRHGKAELRAIT